MEEEIYSISMSVKGKIMIVLIVLGLLSIWILGFYAYLISPQEIPVHFGSSGEPTNYGGKYTLLIFPAIFSISPIIFLLFVKYRFILINKHPYLINLPAFFIYVPKILKEKRGLWVNKYFEVMLCLGVVITFSLLIIELGVFLGITYGELPAWFIPFVLTLPIWLILPFLFYLRKMSLKLEEEIKHT